jgi:hypothetical protein
MPTSIEKDEQTWFHISLQAIVVWGWRPVERSKRSTETCVQVWRATCSHNHVHYSEPSRKSGAHLRHFPTAPAAGNSDLFSAVRTKPVVTGMSCCAREELSHIFKLTEKVGTRHSTCNRDDQTVTEDADDILHYS